MTTNIDTEAPSSTDDVSMTSRSHNDEETASSFFNDQAVASSSSNMIEAEVPLPPSPPTERADDDVLIEVGNVPESEGVGTVIFTYPTMPEGTDFETYRKTDLAWNRIVDWYNRENGPEHDAEGSVKMESIGKEWKERFILQHWPRDPNGQPLLGNTEGKFSSNGQPLWGSTLYDFYMVERIPGLANLRTITTGSRMAAFCKKIGELDFAQSQIDQAEMEERPTELPAYPTWKLIEEMEELVRQRKQGKSLKGKGKDVQEDEVRLSSKSAHRH